MGKNTVGMTNYPILKVWTGEMPCFMYIWFRGANVMFFGSFNISM